jgi:hypothetical protein
MKKTEQQTVIKKLSLAGFIITLGIVFGDLGTSPLYTMRAIIIGGADNFNDLIAQEEGANAEIISNKTEAHTTRNNTNLTSATTVTNMNVVESNTITSNEAAKITRIAQINAAANITSQLQHLIG